MLTEIEEIEREPDREGTVERGGGVVVAVAVMMAVMVRMAVSVPVIMIVIVQVGHAHPRNAARLLPIVGQKRSRSCNTTLDILRGAAVVNHLGFLLQKGYMHWCHVPTILVNETHYLSHTHSTCRT